MSYNFKKYGYRYLCPQVLNKYRGMDYKKG